MLKLFLLHQQQHRVKIRISFVDEEQHNESEREKIYNFKKRKEKRSENVHFLCLFVFSRTQVEPKDYF